LKEIKAKHASILNERWHSRLPLIHWSNIVRNTHYICYGYYFNNFPIGVAIWSSPVAQNRFKDGKKMIELRRMALSEDCPKNTASWSISLMVKKIRKKFPEINYFISYQDKSVHKGTIYAASGWTAANEIRNVSWTTKTRKRNPTQANGDKIRWEKSFK